VRLHDTRSVSEHRNPVREAQQVSGVCRGDLSEPAARQVDPIGAFEPSAVSMSSTRHRSRAPAAGDDVYQGSLTASAARRHVTSSSPSRPGADLAGQRVRRRAKITWHLHGEPATWRTCADPARDQLSAGKAPNDGNV